MCIKIYDQLILLADPKYQSFSQKLLPGVENILGVRLPLLRKIAKKIAKGEIEQYFKKARSETFEEIMLQGMVIGYMDRDYQEVECRIKSFLPKIDNWSVCDSFCMGLKITEEYPDKMWDFLMENIVSSHEYTIRFVIVMLLRFYITESYILKCFKVFDEIHHEGYYVKMAVAWAISACYVKFPEHTKVYLNNNNLDDFTYNKAIQKITESLAVDKETKERIRKIKRK